MNFIFNKVKTIIKGNSLIKCGDKIIIAVSGGPDSLALLFILNSIRKEFGLTLYVAHLNHKLRKNAKSDALFVKKITEDLNLRFFYEEADIKKFAKSSSIEECAREARFKFLFKIAKKFNANKIALGHTKDDQAETVLMRILRGAGLYGLRGILPKKEIDGFTIIRPLIEISREEINRYLTQIKIKPRIDSSNFKNVYFRNKIRNQLLPLLKKDYNKNITEVLNYLAENVGMDYEYLHRESLSFYNKVVRKNSRSKAVISLNSFLKVHPAIQRMIIRIAIRNLVGNLRRLSFRHWKEIEDLILKRPTNSVVDLPNQIKVKKGKDQIVISLRNT